MAGESARAQARRAREKSERLARYAANWEKGAEGESQTAAALGHLGGEWTHWHDLEWPGRRFANIDHLVVGPSGIFVIDSKNWSGTLTVKNNVLRQNGYGRESAVAGCADSALAVGAILPRYMDRVRPVLCFVQQSEVDGWVREVMLCSTTNVVTMLTSRKPVLDTNEIADIVTTLQLRVNSMSGQNRSAQRSGADRATTLGPSPAALHRPSRPPSKARTRFVKRCATGVGLWFVACNAAFLFLQPYVGESGRVFAPTYAALAVVAWLVARRLIR